MVKYALHKRKINNPRTDKELFNNYVAGVGWEPVNYLVFKI